MSTVFSHIVQKRFSQEYENIATDALAFILNSSESAKRGLMKLLQGINPELTSIQFRTQQSEENARPDMWGFDGTVPRVFIENKFWAGLTENQPVTYLERLAKHSQSSVLLVVVPSARGATVWRELTHRLADAKVSTSGRDNSVGIFNSVRTSLGPTLALTSWSRLLSAIEEELTDDPQPKNDLQQLRALCDSADSQAFLPISPAEVTDQRTPAFMLQLSEVVQEAVDLAVSDTKGILSTKTFDEANPRKGQLNPTHTWSSIGRYICFPKAQYVGAWIGTDFQLWREHGGTPLWIIFYESKFCRGVEVRGVLEPWASIKGVFSANHDFGKDGAGFVVAIDLVTGEEKDQVVRSVADQLINISEPLSRLPPLDRLK